MDTSLPRLRRDARSVAGDFSARSVPHLRSSPNALCRLQSAVSDLRCREMENTFSRGSHLLLSAPAWGLAMNTPSIVKFFAGRSECFVQDGERWRRMLPEDEAHHHTGYDRDTHGPNVGIYVTRRPNGLLRIGFDLWKIDANLRPSVIERLESRWREREAVNLSNSMLRRVSQRAHISKSFARFEISVHRLEEWRLELESILSDPNTYESI
jgi:hypothetical protein